MQADDPPFLPVGTDVSAKYKGAFCEAKIKNVVRNIKCKVTFKATGIGSATVSDNAIKGTLRVGNTVEVKLDQKKEFSEAIITKIQDCSQYTVVFDDGDITTLRRSALCLKSGRHFAESETLDQLPLTHPEHFGNPVIGSSGRRGRRTNRTQSDDSDSDASESAGTGTSLVNTVTEREPHAGRIVLVQCSTADKKRTSHTHQWFPGLVVAPNAQDTVKIKVKDDYLVRSFKDGRYYTVPKKEAKEFRRHNASTDMGGMEAALLYCDKGILPPHWDKDILFGQEPQSQSDEIDSDDDDMDDEPHLEKDHFVAQLYKFMDDRGTPLNRQPTIANKDIDLYRLFNVVQKLGGYNKVTNQNQWKRIATRLGFQPATTSVTNLCRQAYKKFLHSFEDFYRKLGVTLLSTPRSARSTGRSLIRDKDKMHTALSQKSASPAPSTTSEEKSTEPPVKAVKTKEKEPEKEIKKEKETKVKEVEVKEKEVKPSVKDKEVKEKEIKEVKEKEKPPEKEKEVKGKEKSKDVKEKETKEKGKEKESNTKSKQKEPKIKSEPVTSSEDDSADNQPLIPLSIKSEKIETPPPVEKPIEVKTKAADTPKTPKLFKSASGTIDGKRSEKNSAKKIAQRRNSLPRINPSGNKSDSNSSKEGKTKPASETSSKKQSPDTEKPKPDKEPVIGNVNKKHPSTDKNDSDSSRGSKNGKAASRKNTTSNESTPPSTPNSSNNQVQSNKKPRKRKSPESADSSTPQVISADVGDKLKVYYGPTHSESKVTYEAKVIEIDGKGPETLLRVHYTGWNTRYDEWIKPTRIADNLTQHSKNKHKDKGKRSTSGNGSDSSVGKKSRVSRSPVTTSSGPGKPHTRNRSSSNNTTSTRTAPDNLAQSDSDSDGSESNSLKQQKKSEESKVQPADKESSTSNEKIPETPKEKSKITKLNKTPQTKRFAEGSQSRVKRARLKPDDTILPRGRDYDLNEIRSELKGLDTTMKSPGKDAVKTEAPSQPDESKLSYKQEKTPEKVTEDIYEFKEPEPFEFEARKSEEKKKRTTHRIFDDIPPLKLNMPEKPLNPEVEKITTKPHFEPFEKICRNDNFGSVSESSSSKEGEAASIFREFTGDDSGDKLMISETEDSQEMLFTYQPELFPDKPYIPIFKSFTASKNQETYSKKEAAEKLQDIDDDFTNSPIKGEQSSDEDPIDAAIQRVNAHSMSDDSNDVDLLIKTPATPTAPQGGLLATFSSDSSSVSDTKTNVEKTDNLPKSKLEVLLKLKPEPTLAKPAIQESVDKKEPIVKSDVKTTAMEVCDTSPENKTESENSSLFVDVIMPEPPPGFIINREVPSIAEKVLRAINNAKLATTPPINKEPPKISKEVAKRPKSLSPKNPVLKLGAQKPTVELSKSLESIEITAPVEIKPIDKLEEVKVEIKEVSKKETVPVVPEPLPKVEISHPKPDIVAPIKKDLIERRKSIAEPSLGGKSNKVLNETIQKLSSQIGQSTPSLPLPEYQADDQSDTTDSDVSDTLLIIDKLSEEESQSCISMSENSTSQPSKNIVEKSNLPWSNMDSIQDLDNEKSSNVPELNVKDSITKQSKEDSNISLLLCEETIPGSPAPENLSEVVKNVSKARTRNLEMPFGSPPSINMDVTPKEMLNQKDLPHEKEVKENRESIAPRNEREPREGNHSNADTVMVNTPPTTPESSLGNISPSGDQQLSDLENAGDSKNTEDSRILAASKKMNELEKSNSGVNIRISAPNSPGVGRRGRRPRSSRLSDSEDPSGLTHIRPLKYNFCVDLDPTLDGSARITLITTRLTELRKVYNDLKAELATIDRRRKKLRRKEREAIKAAKAACS